MKRRRVIKTFSFLAILVLLVGLGAFFFNRLPEGTAQYPLPGVQVNLLSPSYGTQVYPGDQLSVAIAALADQSIAKVELYADGLLMESEAYPIPLEKSIQVNWAWIAGLPGPHILVARATDNQGLIGQSSPVLVSVLYKPPVEPYETREGETLETVALLLHLDPAALGGANPGLDPTAPLPADQQVKLPGSGESSEPPPTPPPPTGQDAGDPPGKLEVAFNNVASMITGDFPPAPPQLDIDVQGCQVKLVITPLSGDALGYTIFGFQIAAQNFVKLADIGPGQDPLAPIAWSDPYPPLTHFQYFVIAFNAKGSTLSNFVGIASVAKSLAEAGCFGKDGDGLIIQGKLPIVEFSATIPVDQSYCYFSKGDGSWFRYPENEFQFFQQGPLTGLESFFLPSWPFPSAPEPTQLMAECWGWQEGYLQYLGMASASVPPNPVIPKIEIKNEKFTLSSPGLGFAGDYGIAIEEPILPPTLGKTIPPPSNLREADGVDVCEGHGGYKVSPSPCNQIGTSLKQYHVLVWDWAPKTCWPGLCPWNNKIAGFRVYKIEQSKPPIPLMDVPPDITTAAVPLPFATYTCYQVRAFSNAGGFTEFSDFTTKWCPGDKPQAKTISLKPTKWITTTHIWTHGDCVGYNDTKGMWPDQVMVGLYNHAYADCDWDQRTYDAAVKFDLTPISQVGQPVSVQKAILTFSPTINPGEYKGSLSIHPLCATDLGLERLAWESWDPVAAANGQTEMLAAGNNAGPYKQMEPFGGFSVDVTGAVIYWLNNQQQNHGFALWTDYNDLKKLGINSSADLIYCTSKLWDFSLEVQYYEIP